MRAILMGAENEARGGPEMLTLAEVPAPEGASPILGLEMSGEAVARALESEVWPLFAPSGGGKAALRPVTHAVLPLAEAAEAHRMLEAAAHRGKILLRV